MPVAGKTGKRNVRKKIGEKRAGEDGGGEKKKTKLSKGGGSAKTV